MCSSDLFESAAIITRPAVSFLEKIHNRMPTFLPPERYADWLNPQINEINAIRKIMDVAQPAADLAAHPVSTKVNLVRNNGAELTLPVELGEPETLF